MGTPSSDKWNGNLYINANDTYTGEHTDKDDRWSMLGITFNDRMRQEKLSHRVKEKTLTGHITRLRNV